MGIKKGFLTFLLRHEECLMLENPLFTGILLFCFSVPDIDAIISIDSNGCNRCQSPV